MERYYVMKKDLEMMREDRSLRWINENNPLRFSAPITSGVYLVGNTLFNPNTKEEIYLVKVGYSKNIASRMRTYNSTNPLVFHIDFMEMEKDEALCSEVIFHWLITAFGGQMLENCNEWFKVSKEFYEEICSGGFAHLMLLALSIDDKYFEELADYLNSL